MTEQINHRRFSVAISLALSIAPHACGQHFIRRTKLRVAAPTTIDWTYAASGRSHAEIPEQLTPGYKSTAQRYDLYAPVGRVGGPLPVILFISYRGTPMAWNLLGPTCVREGVIYIEPHGAGNSTPSAKRIRIALDCLDEVRRNFPTDPDRTYIAGYSGGGNIASQIAIMLPEYFGGLIASNMTVGFPPTAWHRDRMANRLSIASIVGENEIPGFEMSRIHTPLFQELGIRARCHVLPRRGHFAPPPQPFDSAFRWLEQATAARRRTADARPVLRIEAVVSREVFAAAALDDCKTLLDDAGSVYQCLGMLREIKRRWPDLVVADEAAALLDEYAARSEQPWLEDQRVERLRQARLMAQTYESATRVRSGVTKLQRAIYARNAISNYEIIARDTKDENESSEASQRMEALRPNAEITAPKRRSASRRERERGPRAFRSPR